MSGILVFNPITTFIVPVCELITPQEVREWIERVGGYQDVHWSPQPIADQVRIDVVFATEQMKLQFDVMIPSDYQDLVSEER